MGIDVVRRIFDHANVKWQHPGEIAPAKQDEAIREYSKQEFEYIRHLSQDGRIKYEIADRLCWLAKECILKNEVTKNGKRVPVVKNHIDISETAIRELELHYPASADILHELIRTGVLFPLQGSRAREAHDATRRYMIRRILLARYTGALGRDLPIKIDDVQRLQFFLTEPGEFVSRELSSSTSTQSDVSTTDNNTTTTREADSTRQMTIFDFLPQGGPDG